MVSKSAFAGRKDEATVKAPFHGAILKNLCLWTCETERSVMLENGIMTTFEENRPLGTKIAAGVRRIRWVRIRR